MRPVTFVLGGLTVLASLAVAIVLYRGFGNADVQFGVRSYTVLSDHAVRVVFEVDKDRARTAVCRVRARDAGGAETGAQDVPVGPAGQGRVVVTYELATRDRAVSGEVTGCALTADSRG